MLTHPNLFPKRKNPICSHMYDNFPAWYLVCLLNTNWAWISLPLMDSKSQTQAEHSAQASEPPALRSVTAAWPKAEHLQPEDARLYPVL